MSLRAILFVPTILTLLAGLFPLIESKVIIEPNPYDEVGIMSSESRYFNCKSDSARSGQQEVLVWLDNRDREIVNDPANRIYTTKKKNVVKLELKNPQKEDSGYYKCVARSKSGQEQHKVVFKLNVYHPTVVSGNNNYIKAEGEQRFRMECQAIHDKDAQIDFTWMFGNYDVAADQSGRSPYRIDVVRDKTGRQDEIRTISRLEIRTLSKEHDGKYSCLVDSSNKFLSDEKELKIQLHVQYKPRFDEKTPRYIWISEETVQQGGQQAVNISCIVQADPVAKIRWLNAQNQQVQTQRMHQGGQNVRTVISDAENMSTLTLHYRSIDELKNPRQASRHRYTCIAENQQGTAQNTFEIKVGRIPDSPHIAHIEYMNGAIHLRLNETPVEPPVDAYRLEIAEEKVQAHMFNKSANIRENNTYVIDLPLPRGEHKVSIFAHNPVGWSENPYASYFLTVVSGAPSLSPPTTAVYIAMLFLLTLGQMAAMEGRGVARFFIGSLIQY